MLRKDKSGFTLVELMISMGVLSIVIVTISIFMLHGSNSYKYTKAELDLQMQSQILIAQLDDMAKEANYTVYDDATHTLSFYQIEKIPDPADATKKIKNVKSKTMIYWDSDSKALYLEQASSDATPTYTASEEALLSEFIEGFEVKVNDSAVTVKLDMKNTVNRYEVDEVISMRNRIVTYP